MMNLHIFIKDKVYKYNIDEKNIKKIKNIASRKFKKNMFTSINKKSNNFFTYDYVKGVT